MTWIDKILGLCVCVLIFSFNITVYAEKDYRLWLNLLNMLVIFSYQRDLIKQIWVFVEKHNLLFKDFQYPMCKDYLKPLHNSKEFVSERILCISSRLHHFIFLHP